VWEDVARISVESDAPLWSVNSVDSEAILLAPQSDENYLEALFVFSED
jgi:aldose 1-epimerase